MGVVGVFIGANTSKRNVRHGRAFSTAAAQLGGFRATSGRRSECHLRWLGGVYGLWAPPFVRWVIYFPLGALPKRLQVRGQQARCVGVGGARFVISSY